MLLAPIPTNSSHTSSLESLQEESSAGLSHISHCLSSNFQRRNALNTCSSFSSAWKNCPSGAFIRLLLLIKDWGKCGREITKITMQKKLQSKEKRGKRNHVFRMFRNSLCSLERLFFPQFWLVFTSPIQTSKSRNRLGWALHNPSCGGWN